MKRINNKKDYTLIKSIVFFINDFAYKKYVKNGAI